MRTDTRPTAHLTYCLNVHPGETWEQNLRAMETHVAAVRDTVAPSLPFGLGLRLSAVAARKLSTADNIERFKEFLDANNFYVFTINGFPYGEFHGKPVKTNVYRPDWRDTHRVAYTNELVDILAAVLPEGIDGSISTVPISYRPWIQSDADRSEAVDNLRICARHMAKVEARTGRRIRLALEPEPYCYLENTPDTIRFFEELRSKEEGDLLLAYVGVCFDTCHLAVQYEDLQSSLQQLIAAGIAIPKMQISAALRISDTAHAREKLAPFADAVYLHQVKTRSGERVDSYEDLPAFLDALLSGTEAGEARVHCHVPLYFEGTGDLGSTNVALTPELFGCALRAGIDHFEIETYTFNVLPPELQAKGVVNSIAEEYRWVMHRLPQPTRVSSE